MATDSAKTIKAHVQVDDQGADIQSAETQHAAMTLKVPYAMVRDIVESSPAPRRPSRTTPATLESPRKRAYIESEARRRGVSTEEVRKELAEIDATMPSMEALDDLTTPIPKAWLEDTAWDNYAP